MQQDVTYFTGKPCKRGHISPRFVKSRNCVECNRERGRVARMTEKQRNAKRERMKSAYWREPDLNRERSRVAGKQFYARHPKRVLADTRFQQIKKQQRTPPWADLVAIREFYESCPNDYEVDHIIPLNGATVSGLHVLENLQYLPARENRAKGNKF